MKILEDGRTRIQNGDCDTDAGSVSSINQRPCWDAGAMLGRGEATGRVETLAPWTPSLWGTSPCHDTLGPPPSRCQRWPPAPNVLGRPSADQTGESQASRSIPQPPLAQHPWTVWSPLLAKKKILNKQWNWKLAHSRRGGGCWKCTGEGGRGKELNSCEPSVNKWQEGHQQAGDRSLPEVGKERRQQTTGHPLSDGSAELRNKQWTITTYWQQQLADRSLTLPLPQGKGTWQRHKPLVSKHRDKPTPKQDN
jgi:hypothetical protein